MRIRIKGRSITASRAHLGLNPVPRVRAAVLDVVEAYERDMKKRTHPLLPSGSCTPTVLRAGVKENAVADYCELSLDRRLLPGETVDSEVNDLKARLAGSRILTRTSTSRSPCSRTRSNPPRSTPTHGSPTECAGHRRAGHRITDRDLRHALRKRRSQPRQRRRNRGDHIRPRRRHRMPLPQRTRVAPPGPRRRPWSPPRSRETSSSPGEATRVKVPDFSAFYRPSFESRGGLTSSGQAEAGARVRNRLSRAL